MKLQNNETSILQIPYHNYDTENHIIKNCLFSDFEKYHEDLKKGKIKFMVVKDTGFIVVDINKKYFDLLGGIKQAGAENAVEKTAKLILEYCKNNNLIFRVQTDLKKIAEKYLKIKGFKCIQKMPLYLLYNKGV